ncbi:cytochrome-c oxidase, cbb3-type subunit III [Photobacterium aphoticum]|uniref:Cbb3-type cytochrome c oxidase subunit n=1 Tax=Photobacterium aphoticum TaxID=754436 RepID=A0A0J1GLK9_9GAMM|nr:cytochrome-c oxidase, cbb3-type subunit III [Photobacterium aphoticum]KLV00506.1 cytochrome Cbb3 [Photobacterium aphoticum]PSU59859.1 cytochrome-c oxidase, cbb3-type subunit III [Photobacterium aphoticum]GHA41753.1 Cbb3-type cytochrome c oxidase subunit [Photobacterium aphoticum]
MTTFWSLWITIITIATFVGVAALLVWCSRDTMGVAEGEDMGHEYDGIREINNPLPKWWSYMFWGTLVFGAVYLVLYPGLGSFKGVLGWQSSDQTVRSLQESNASIANAHSEQRLDQYARELDAAEAEFGETFKRIAYDASGNNLRPITDIAQDEEALKVGQRLFLQNCAQCHASDARGQLGYPNLADGAWLYGGEAETIKTTIMEGRIGVMPAWIDSLGADGVTEVTSYVLSMSGRKVNAKEAAAGKQKFVVCAACHGTDGKGNPAFGAPDLTDNTWLYGGSRRAVEDTIIHGRQGVMPAWKDILGEEKIQVISAYVWSLSNDTKK